MADFFQNASYLAGSIANLIITASQNPFGATLVAILMICIWDCVRRIKD